METSRIGIEVDFLAVGDASSSADAIAIRYGDLHSGSYMKQQVVIIDGGTKQSGQDLVEHVKKHYKTNYVDLVVMTHPDRDHASGLSEVMNGLSVGQLWMHQPWNHSDDIMHRFIDGRITNSSLDRRLRVSMDAAHEVEQIAKKNGIKIVEPFAGLRSADGVISVLGPTKDYYQSLIPGFSKSPESDYVSETTLSKGREVQVVYDPFNQEALPGKFTSPENNSSAVLLFQIPGRKVLIVGDAGIPALETIITYANKSGIGLDNLDLLQVPHHGSKKNVNTKILNTIKASTAFISAAKNGAPKHPSQRVINSLIRRGTNVLATQGQGLCHFYNAPAREGWGPIGGFPFLDRYEE